MLFSTKFRVNWPLDSRDEFQYRFSRWRLWRHLEFPIGTIIAVSDLQIAPILRIKFWVNWPFSLGEEAQNTFFNGCHGSHLGYPVARKITIFDLQVVPILHTKLRVDWPFASGKEVQNIFSRWQPLQPSWISECYDFSGFWFVSHPDTSLQVSSMLSFRFRRRS